ncbi:hypothetical protein AB0F77_38815 [Streptomyces sp. NPDC026672]|uniref:hypothetical protein n=1 Tax=unclassified Streptomyces TaxID=2593676 RepID=UPI003401AD80
MYAASDGLAKGWLSDLAAEQSYPQDFYDAFEAALHNPLVRHRSTRTAAEDERIGPYAASDHPPPAEGIRALPDVEGAIMYGAQPLVLRGAAVIEWWCVPGSSADWTARTTTTTAARSGDLAAAGSRVVGGPPGRFRA